MRGAHRGCVKLHVSTSCFVGTNYSVYHFVKKLVYKMSYRLFKNIFFNGLSLLFRFDLER